MEILREEAIEKLPLRKNHDPALTENALIRTTGGYVKSERLSTSIGKPARMEIMDKYELVLYFISERGTRVHPNPAGFFPSRVFPLMRRRAFKTRSVARTQAMPLRSAQRSFELATQHIQKFLTVVSVGFAATSTGPDSERMRFHHCLSPGEQLDADAGADFHDLAFVRPNPVRTRG